MHTQQSFTSSALNSSSESEARMYIHNREKNRVTFIHPYGRTRTVEQVARSSFLRRVLVVLLSHRV